MIVSTRSCPTCHAPLSGDGAFCAQCGAPTNTQILGEVSTRVYGRVSASYELEPARLQRAVGSHFELGRLIGRGGYAEVFSARDTRLKRDLAIKVIRPDLIVTQSLLARFRREAEAVAVLKHPQIVPIYDVGEADGICFIVMPLIQGESLKSVLLREGRLPLEEVLRILSEAASALAAAHDAGVIHRDIKPENIMLEGPERRVLLMDFGIAKAVDAADAEVTATGVIVGTPQYMSPEQASGDPNVDHRADQYSLAVVGYQMISGRVPFEGETARAVMAKQLLEDPPSLATLVEDVPLPVAKALERAMQKDPQRRFESITVFSEALNAPLAQWKSDWELPAERFARRRWVPWAIAAAVVVVSAAVMRWYPARAEPDAATTLPAPVPAPPPAPPAAAIVVPPPSPLPPPPPAPVVVAESKTAPTQVAPPPTPPAASDTAAREAAPKPKPVDCVTLYQQEEWGRAAGKCLEEARAGNLLAARNVGALIAEGRGGVTVSETEMLDYLTQAAKNGNAHAQFQVAQHYAMTDPTLATEMFLSAAKAKVKEAYPWVALRLDQGLGTPRNEAEAARWYEEAAKTGHVPSQATIASMYARGRGVGKDEARAKYWYEMAAKGGNSDAAYELGMMYLKGKGVEKSESDALLWLKRAADAGHAEAKRELTRRATSRTAPPG